MQQISQAKEIIETLNRAGFEAYLVGGCVRDYFLDREPKDYDIATSASVDQVRDLFEYTADTGIAYGTITVLLDHEPYEVTTFRKEGKYSDHRRPDEVVFVKNIDEDLSRRDFTVNAMAWHPEKGLIDPFHGKEDLEKGIIRAVGDPETRFEEDALRMMRAYRFAAQCHFEIDERTKEAIDKKKDLLKEVSAERIAPEMEKIMQYDPLIIEQMTELLKDWIPQLKIMKETEQNTPYHYANVLNHTLDALNSLSEDQRKNKTVCWALLMHDSGKPAVKTSDDHKDHFNRHEEASVIEARKVFGRLKLPNRMKKDALALIEYHDTFYKPRPRALYKMRVENKWSDQLVQMLFEVQYGDIMAHAIKDRLAILEEFKRFYNVEKNLRPLNFDQLAVNGTELIKELDISGPVVGELKSELLKYAFYHPNKNNRNDLLAAARTILKEISA